MEHVSRYAYALPVGSEEHRASGWWGMWMLIATEAALFSYLLFGYFYLASQTGNHWPTEGLPKLRLALPNTIVLIASSFAAIWAERAMRAGQRGRSMLGLAITIALGTAFVYVQVLEWRAKPFGITTDAFGSLYFTITGFHVAHVVIGLIVLVALFVWTALGLIGQRRHAPLTIGALYWHFVDVVWLAVFFTFYLNPYLAR